MSCSKRHDQGHRMRWCCPAFSSNRYIWSIYDAIRVLLIEPIQRQTQRQSILDILDLETLFEVLKYQICFHHLICDSGNKCVGWKAIYVWCLFRLPGGALILAVSMSQTFGAKSLQNKMKRYFRRKKNTFFLVVICWNGVLWSAKQIIGTTSM